MTSANVKKFQDQLIKTGQAVYAKNPLSESVIDAFYAIRRHEFVPKYRLWKNPEWISVNPENLEQHLSIIYADQPAIIYGSDEDFENGSSPVRSPLFLSRHLYFE